MRRFLALSIALGLLGSFIVCPSKALAQPGPTPGRRVRPPRPVSSPSVLDDGITVAHAVPLSSSMPTLLLEVPLPRVDDRASPEWRYPGIDISVGTRVFTRSLSWSGDTTQAMRPYDSSAAPTLRLGVELFPGAITDSRVARLFGVVLQYDRAIALITVDMRGRNYETSSSSFLAGVKVRAPFDTERHEIAVILSFRRQDFTVRAEGDMPVNGAPDLGYASLQLGIASRWQLSHRVALSLDAAYLAVLDTGQLAAVFPHTSSFGVDIVAGVAVAIALGIEVRAGLDFRSYFHALNPEPGDRYSLTGATDQQLAGWLAIGVRR